MHSLPRFLCTALLLTFALTLTLAPSPAEAQTKVANIFVEGDIFVVEPQVAHDSLQVILEASDGCVVVRDFKATGQAVIPLVDDKGEPLRDGAVRWSVTLEPKLDGSVRDAMNRARLEGDDKFGLKLIDEGILPAQPLAVTGGLLMSKGVAADPEIDENGRRDANASESDAEATRAAGAVSEGFFSEPATGFLAEEQLITGNLTVRSSLCVGTDCPHPESFGFDTIRVKENNLRIHFEDTSSTASFPTNDWRIIANDSANGGSSYLGFQDATANRNVFRVFAGAPSNALTVDSQGDLGLGTATPVTDIHAVDGDTPTLRLEQNGSSGFSPQTFDVAANEANFFIRDATNGSTLPFRIRPGASSNAVYINSDDNIGFGTASPDASLHVVTNQSSNFGGLRVENNGTGNIQTQFANNNGGWEWRQTFRSGDLIFDSQEDGDNELELDINGELTVVSLVETSDRAAKENFRPVDRSAVLSKIVELPITRWNYISQGAEIEHLGPMAQDFYGAFGVGPDDKHIATRDAASVALVGVQALHAELEARDAELRERDARVEALEAANAALLQRLEALEQLIQE
ncbi:MAG: tail fiber domain-containing protein [Acidobacteriota bacterium]